VFALIISSLALAAWVLLAFAWGFFWVAGEEPLPERAQPSPVAVVIPARNEAPMIGEALASLLAQDYPGPTHLILVDDNSTDATAAVARQLSPAIDVLPGAPLPPGWTGKMWAVHQGVTHALRRNPEFLLLTDADIVHSPDHLRRLVAAAQAGTLDLVSHMVLLRAQSLAERLAIPAFVFFFFMLYPPRRIAAPRSTVAGAAGGSILLRRTALDRIGGIPAIAHELIDDCALAARIKRSGGRIRLGLTRHTRSIRAYAGPGEIWQMISRTAFTQLRYNWLLLAGTLLGMALLYLAPPALALAAHGLPARLALGAWAVLSVLYLPMLRFYRRSPLCAPLLPAVALFYTAATFYSALQHARGLGGQWKGRAQSHASV
jgi:hopene-associated glycosyltransferase HpnB